MKYKDEINSVKNKNAAALLMICVVSFDISSDFEVLHSRIVQPNELLFKPNVWNFLI